MTSPTSAATSEQAERQRKLDLAATRYNYPNKDECLKVLRGLPTHQTMSDAEIEEELLRVVEPVDWDPRAYGYEAKMKAKEYETQLVGCIDAAMRKGLGRYVDFERVREALERLEESSKRPKADAGV